jgi:hypothetical protein
MPVLWLAVLDEPGPGSVRAYIERNAIALLSNTGRSVDGPSGNWLGRHSSRLEIRESGLWNLNHLSAVSDPQFLDVLEDAIRAMNGGCGDR